MKCPTNQPRTETIVYATGHITPDTTPPAFRHHASADPADRAHAEDCPAVDGFGCHCDEYAASLQRLQEIGAALDKLLNEQQE